MEDQKEKSEQKVLSKVEYDFGVLRKDFLELQEKVVSRLMQFDSIKKQIDAKLAQIDPLSAINVKKIAQLKQLGVNPKDLLRAYTSNSDGQEKERA